MVFRDDLLLMLADYLEKLPAKDFDMALYFHECGTAACALGHATEIKEFRDAGFYRHYKSIRLKGHPFAGLNAAELLLGIDFREANDLFLPSGYRDSAFPFNPTPQETAAKIRLFVAKKQKGN